MEGLFGRERGQVDANAAAVKRAGAKTCAAAFSPQLPTATGAERGMRIMRAAPTATLKLVSEGMD